MSHIVNTIVGEVGAGLKVNGTKQVKASANPVSPLDLLKSSDSFANRHLGPKGAKVEHMLEVLEVTSLDALIEQTIPQTIRLNRTLKLPNPLSERGPG
jgi:hypothetical protein